MTIFKLALAAFVALIVGAWAEGAKAGADWRGGPLAPVACAAAPG